MNKAKLKQGIPYIGLLVLMATLLVWKYVQLDGLEILLREVLVVFCYVAAVGDIREKKVPNRLVGAMLGAWVLIMVPQLFFQTELAIYLLLSGAIGFLMAGIVFLGVYLISKKGLGGGDVKLMAVAGLYLGYDKVMPAMLYGAVLAAVVGIILILAKKIGRKDAIPLVPFLLIGILTVSFVQ